MKRLLLALLTFFCANAHAQNAGASANVKLWLPAIFGDHMVLQQVRELPVWGRAPPGENVRVTVGDRSGEVEAGADGRWVVRLEPMPVTQEALQVAVSCAGEEEVFDDVLIGDVWLCAGQANMAMGIGNMKTGKQVVAKANHPKLRLFLMPRSVSFDKAEDVDAEWIVCTPESLAPQGYGWGGFSAIGYYFGSALLRDRNVPIRIEGDGVVVWREQGIQAQAVRYAWAPNPEPPANLYNREGLPASPFRIQSNLQ